MSKGLIFFCCACCILVLTIINLSIGPIISGHVTDWGTRNCASLKDGYDEAKKGNLEDWEKKYDHEWYIDRCDRRKAMSNMEYTSFIFDIVIGFVCGLIGLLHLFEVKKDMVATTGLIGLVCGVVGFVLTLVYVIYNGLVYTNYYDTSIYKINGDGAFAELKGDKYECLYFDEQHNDHALRAKFSDIGKKQYNYEKDFSTTFSAINPNCRQISPSACDNVDGFISPKISYLEDGTQKDCQFLYDNSLSTSSWKNQITNKDQSDRFLTTLILSLFVCLANIGLALFGFLLFRSPSDF